MYVDFIKLLFLIFSFTNGKPITEDIAWQVSFKFTLPENAPVVELAFDYVPVYSGYLNGDLCGVAYGAFAIIDPRYKEKGCENTLQHELAHIWQYRSYGLILPITYPFMKDFWETDEPWHKIPETHKILNFPLIKFYIPLTLP